MKCQVQPVNPRGYRVGGNGEGEARVRGERDSRFSLYLYYTPILDFDRTTERESTHFTRTDLCEGAYMP